MTSHDVVAQVRRRYGRDVKVGHAGTLDPFATGLLLVLVGQATRVQRFLMELPKTYRTVARLGWTSDSGDRDGRLEYSGRIPARLEIPTGELMQRPPAYSAVKVGGERLYKKARRGETVEVAPRAITVHRAECLWRAEDRAEFEIECSSGTYVRSLISDLRDAYCDELRRTRIGRFRVEDASDELLALEEALTFLPACELTGDQVRQVRHGVGVPAGPELAARRSHDALRLMHDGRLIAFARVEEETLKPFMVIST